MSSENSWVNFLGITNYEEYSLIQEVTDDKKEDSSGTLKKDRTLLLRDERKMEKLKAKLHTDDDCECDVIFSFTLQETNDKKMTKV